MTTYYIPADHTADEWTALARKNAQESADSFERCDTDGFLSQWASDATARMYRTMAEVAAENNTAELAWPFVQTDAGWVPADDHRWVEGKYGSSVLVTHDGDRRFWNPSAARKAATRLANDSKKGLAWGTVRCEVVGRFGGGWNAQPVLERKIGAALTVVATPEQRYTIDY